MNHDFMLDHHSPPSAILHEVPRWRPWQIGGPRGSFCSPQCRNADKKARRAWRASKACRLCGRAARRSKVASSQCAPGVRVLGVIAQTEYMAAQAAIGGLHG